MQKLSLFFILVGFISTSNAQVVGDFRTVGSGNWNALTGVWERFSNAGTCLNALPAWCPSNVGPTDGDGSVTILAGHSVSTNTTTIDIDQLTVNGALAITSGTLNIKNGSGLDFVINGSFTHSGGDFNIETNSDMVNTGAVTISDNSVNDGNYLQTGGSTTISGGVFDQNQVFNLNGGTLSIAAGATFNNDGTFTEAGGSISLPLNATFTTSSSFTSSQLIENDGTINMNGGTFVLGADLNNNNRINFSGGTINVSSGNLSNTANSVFNFDQNGGTLPTASWAINSTLEISGIVNATSITNMDGQALGEVVFNSTSQTSVFALGAGFDVTNPAKLTVNSTGVGAIGFTGDYNIDYTVEQNGGSVYANSGSATKRTITLASGTDYNLNNGTFLVQGVTTGDSTIFNLEGSLNILGGTFRIFLGNTVGLQPARMNVLSGGRYNQTGGVAVIHSIATTANVGASGEMFVRNGGTYDLTGGDFTVSASSASNGIRLSEIGELTFDPGSTSNISGGTFIVNDGAALGIGRLYANNNFNLDETIYLTGPNVLNIGGIFSEADIYFGGSVFFDTDAYVTVGTELSLLVLSTPGASRVHFQSPTNDTVRFNDVGGQTFSDGIKEINLVANTHLDFVNATTVLDNVDNDSRANTLAEFDMEDQAGLIIRHEDGIVEDGSAGAILYEDTDNEYPSNAFYGYSGSGTNNVTGNGLPSEINGIGSLSIEMDDPTAYVTLDNPVSLNPTIPQIALHLNNGILRLLDEDISLQNNAGYSLKGEVTSVVSQGPTASGDGASFVFTDGAGKFEKFGIAASSSFVFPVSHTAVRYTPVTLRDATASIADFSARAYTEAFEEGVKSGGSAINSRNVRITWDITHLGGGVGHHVQPEWFDVDETIGFEFNRATINHYYDCGVIGVKENGTFDCKPQQIYETGDQGDGWAIVPGTGGFQYTTPYTPPGGPTFTTAESMHVASINTHGRRVLESISPQYEFSPYSIASGSGPLPITLLSFNAIQENNDVIVKWETAMELNHDHYVIERSDDQHDGLEFKEIGKVKSLGNSNSLISYRYTDQSVLPGTHYYRLKSIDLDGSTQYSEIRLVNIEEAQLGMVIFPNPVTTTVLLNLSTSQADYAQISIIDIHGKLMNQIASDLSSGINSIELDMSMYPNGYYFVDVEFGHQHYKKKVLKQ